MTGAIKLWAAALIAALAITRANAADLTPVPEPLPPPAPMFFVHVGALGAFYQPPDAQSTGGGFLKAIPLGPLGTATLSNVAIRPSYTLGLEVGYFVTPNWALALSAGVPPRIIIKATDFNFTNALGTNLVGSGRVWAPHGPHSIPPHSIRGHSALFRRRRSLCGVVRQYQRRHSYEFRHRFELSPSLSKAASIIC